MNRPTTPLVAGSAGASRRRVSHDSGAVAVYVALMLPILLIFTAIAVDISRWYVELQRVQRAADAGALAAAPFMPSNLASTVPLTRPHSQPWPRTA